MLILGCFADLTYPILSGQFRTTFLVSRARIHRAIERVKTRIWVNQQTFLELPSRKAKAAELFRIQRLSLVAGVGFEPTTFRL
jgi:hypothetical protein